MAEPLKIIQISDIHLYGDKSQALLGVRTEESFAAILQAIKNSNENMDLIILSGDLTQDGSAAGYKRIAKSLEDFKVPVYHLPGNHDNTLVMDHVYPLGNIKNDKHIIFKHWQLILLNSQIPDHVQGFFDPGQLSFMQECLSAYPDHHAVILFHHQPTPVGSKWLDALGVQNPEDFWDIVKKHQNVKLISFGHVHQEFNQQINGIQCYATPSTCIQFKRGQDHFGLENLPPGYRWLHLHKDGQVKSAVRRLPKYIGFFDEKATGY